MPTETQDVFSLQRTKRGLAYENMMTGLTAMRDSGDGRFERARQDFFNGVTAQRSVGIDAVYSNKTLQSMSVQYANDAYIGDRLMPIINAGNQPTGTYFVYDKRTRLAYPDDSLGDRGFANEIDDNRGKAAFACQDRGFSNSIAKKVVDAADAPLDEMMDLTEAINEGMAFKREKRQAAILTNPASFAGNTTALAAAVRWDSASGGNPVKDLQDAKKNLWQGRGPGVVRGYCGRDVWDVLARHPMILDLFKYNGSSPGLATPDMLAKWFGMESIVVGDAREDTANLGAAAGYSRIWPNVFGMVRVASRPTIRNASFGYVFRLNGIPKSYQWFDGRIGYDGRWFAKVAVSDDERIVAADTGFLITTPIG